MHEKKQIVTQQLKEICQLTNSSWAIWIVREGEAWSFYYHYGLSKFRRQTLQLLVSDVKLTKHIAGGITTGRTRSWKTGEWEEKLGCRSLFFFPSQDS